MMNVFQLFTATGIAQALHTHHKQLHENYGFAPLGGKKSLHKFAEGFGFANAEPFMAKLTSLTERMLNTSVNLNTNHINTLVHIDVEHDNGEHQIRTMAEGHAAFLIHTVEPTLLAPAIISYESSNTAFVTIGAYIIKIMLDDKGVDATIFRATDPNDVDTNSLSTIDDNNSFEILEENRHMFLDEDDIGWTDEDEEELMDSFMEAMNNLSPQKQENIIPATVASDDDNINIEFDAVDYFESELKNGNIEAVFEALDGCNFDADYPTDTIAEFFADGTTKRLFDYLYSMDDVGEIGYRCTINKMDAFKWLQGKVFERLKDHQDSSNANTDN